MDSKTFSILEYPKILARLADLCDFSTSVNLTHTLTPHFGIAVIRLAETTEARRPGCRSHPIPLFLKITLYSYHRQEHLELLCRPHGVRLVRRHDNGFACLQPKRLTGDTDLCFTVQQMDKGIERSGMLAQLLASVEGE